MKKKKGKIKYNKYHSTTEKLLNECLIRKTVKIHQNLIIGIPNRYITIYKSLFNFVCIILKKKQ